MSDEQQGGGRKHLPWTYWPIIGATLLAVMFLGGALSVVAGVNPYLGSLITGGVFVLYETWMTAIRGGYRL